MSCLCRQLFLFTSPTHDFFLLLLHEEYVALPSYIPLTAHNELQGFLTQTHTLTGSLQTSLHWLPLTSWKQTQSMWMVTLLSSIKHDESCEGVQWMHRKWKIMWANMELASWLPSSKFATHKRNLSQQLPPHDHFTTISTKEQQKSTVT